MAFTLAWRNFKRMEDLTAAAAALIYLAATLRAFERHPGWGLVVATVLLPALHLAAAMIVPLFAPVLRRVLARYVWMSFRAGFGQTPVSVLVGALLMVAAGAALFRQALVAPDALSLAPIFCAFAAGVGVLVAQALLVRAVERRPEVRAIIQA